VNVKRLAPLARYESGSNIEPIHLIPCNI